MSNLVPEKARELLRQKKDLRDVYDDIQEELQRVEESLKTFSSSPNRLIAEISTYLFQKKGKRIRPALLILCSKLLNYRGEEHISMAALVEFIHTASLIHDDIIDKSDFRRGRDTVHTRWGPNISVLLGDYLYIRTIGMSQESTHPEVLRILTDVTSRMIEGELTEYQMSGNLETAEQDYIDIIDKKTASLFSAACQIGAVLGRATPEKAERLVEYGRNLGLAFQVTDDLLDFRGEESLLGKPVLADLSEGRITLPLIYALRNDGSGGGRRLKSLLERKKLDRQSKGEILDIIKAHGALDDGHRKAKAFSLRAKEVVSGFPESTHREALSLLAEFVLDRES
jgi:octaprenyl-diphosphate synthase